jgi:FO synthase subunit 2
MDGNLYIELTKAVKSFSDSAHARLLTRRGPVWCDSPGVPIIQYLKELKDAGLIRFPAPQPRFSIKIRDIIAQGELPFNNGLKSSPQPTAWHPDHFHHHVWTHRNSRPLGQAHESAARHPKGRRGFTEFVPLSLIHQEAPMYTRKLVDNVREGATGTEVVKMHAVARLMLGPTFRNIQSSWVKEGPKMAQYLLTVGANDLGGTLINESISTSAGAQYGQLVPPKELRRLIRDAGRTPAERSTTYKLRKVFTGADEEVSPLDLVKNADERLALSQTRRVEQFRCVHPLSVRSNR